MGLGEGGRNEVGRGSPVVQPSIAARPARWLLKFKDPTATAVSKHASGAQFAAPMMNLCSSEAPRNKYRERTSSTLRSYAITYLGITQEI